MPLYEYRCRKCNTLIEKIQKFSDSPLKICAKCGGKLERLVSASAIQFKGTGWYITDYARKSSPAETGGSEKSSSAKPDSSSGDGKKPTETPAARGSKDSKPAPKK